MLCYLWSTELTAEIPEEKVKNVPEMIKIDSWGRIHYKFTTSQGEGYEQKLRHMSTKCILVAVYVHLFLNILKIYYSIF